MALALYYLLSLISIVWSQESNWELGSTNISSSISNMAVGYFNQSIFLLGGYPASKSRQIIEFHMQNNSFSNMDNSLSTEVWGYSQFYTQVDSKLYIINPNDPEKQILIFDLVTKTINDGSAINIIHVTTHGCLTSSSSNLFIIGGVDSDEGVKTINIYDMYAKSWSTVEYLIKKRARLSCAVHPDNSFILFAIGGTTDVREGYGEHLASIEEIDLTASNSFEIEQMDEKLSSTRAVTFGKSIYIIGGRRQDSSNNYWPSDLIHILDTETNSVIVSVGDILLYGVYSVAAINVNSFIYVFGGTIDTGYTNNWMKLPIQTTDPTSNPSNFPSADPTNEPTIDPTSDPTSNPSVSPTRYTNGPTPGPTLIPTFDPTIYPSFDPTFNPSMLPSSTPTFEPLLMISSTFHPSAQPSNNPTNEPTIYNPTFAPSSGLNSNPSESEQNDTPIIVAFIVVGSFLLIIIQVFCVFICRKVDKIHKEEKKNNDNMIILSNSAKQSENEQHLDNAIQVPGSAQHIQLEVMTPSESTHGMSIDNVNDKLEIKKWLTNEVGLPEYFDKFVSNGFESLDFIRVITNDDQLEEIGISLIGHRIKILEEINKLNEEKNQQDEEGVGQVVEGNATTANQIANDDEFEVVDDQDNPTHNDINGMGTALI